MNLSTKSLIWGKNGTQPFGTAGRLVHHWFHSFELWYHLDETFKLFLWFRSPQGLPRALVWVKGAFWRHFSFRASKSAATQELEIRMAHPKFISELNSDSHLKYIFVNSYHGDDHPQHPQHPHLCNPIKKSRKRLK